ncbi:hypothetical protein [Croceibacterium aestuarii]|uniref:hypothetical protein n=1 Tax=Croceibacterium aestuarii TaxID=3064139 RepID=UPI00272EBCB7|nr:hypothetical protein [Croceibacterium sp. D39]
MIRTTRRNALMGALAVPTVAGLAQWRWRHGDATLLLYDDSLAAGLRFAAAGAERGGQGRAIAGDRVRFGREALAQRPALVAGVSRHADFILLADVAREHGYRPAATIYGRARQCAGHECQPGWQGVGRMARMAGGSWVEALADYAAKPGEAAGRALGGLVAGPVDSGLVLGWVLAPR